MIDAQTFDTKFNFVIDIFQQWMPENFDFSQAVILDFGCEYGIMTLGIALKLKPKKVIGVDINDYSNQLLEIARERLGISVLPENLEFYQIVPAEKISKKFQVDVVFSWSTFEHVNQPDLEAVVRDLYDSLSENGLIFLQIAPLYYSAFGSHLTTLISEPWAHLSMQNNLFRQAVMNVPKQHTIYQNESDSAYEAIKSSLWSCYETLNKITADQLIELFEAGGFKIIQQFRTQCSKEPSDRLKRVFSEELLKTEQIIVLLQKTANHSIIEPIKPKKHIATRIKYLSIKRWLSGYLPKRLLKIGKP